MISNQNFTTVLSEKIIDTEKIKESKGLTPNKNQDKDYYDKLLRSLIKLPKYPGNFWERPIVDQDLRINFNSSYKKGYNFLKLVLQKANSPQNNITRIIERIKTTSKKDKSNAVFIDFSNAYNRERIQDIYQ